MALTLVSGTSRNGRRKGTANPNSYERAILRIGQAIPERVKLSMEHVADEIVATAKKLAPHKSGELQDSISWAWKKTRKGWQIRITTTPAKNPKGVSYGQYAEWDPLFSKTGEKPFLYPAFDAHKDEMQDIIKTAMLEVYKEYGL